MEKRTVAVFTTPAFGHIYSMLHLLEALSEEGYQVICWSTEEFRPVLSRCGEFRPYPIRREELNPSDGKRILKLYRLILEYTWKMTGELAREAQGEGAFCVVYDSLALWGRAAAQILSLPSVAFYSILGIDRWFGPAFFAYARGFSSKFLLHAGELPRIFSLRRKLRRGLGLKRLGLFSCLMNKGDWNLMNYSRKYQPGGERFGEEYLFLGPGACHRRADEREKLPLPDQDLICISLGTVFNDNQEFWDHVVNQFGGSPYQILLIGYPRFGRRERLPENFAVRSFVNQREVLGRASLFITSGGLNSLHEALLCGVPCLGCPQQGEQELNLRRMEKLGFGRILKNPDRMYEEARALIRERAAWNERLRNELTADRLEKFMSVFRQMA